MGASDLMASEWLWAGWSEVGLVLLSVPLMLAAIIATIRVNGLRSFSKMSSFDFAVTVAIGSVLASVVATSTSLVNGVVAVVGLFVVQSVIATLRRRTSFEVIVDNSPVMLMRDGKVFEDALGRTSVTRSDLVAKLREANVLQVSEVQAVVLESTGDVSVVHGDVGVDDVLLDGIRVVGRATPLELT